MDGYEMESPRKDTPGAWGAAVETNANDFDYTKLLYEGNAFYFYMDGTVEIVCADNTGKESVPAACDDVKEYVFKEEIAKFNIREPGLNIIW